MTPTITIIRGLPGSGKSQLGRRLGTVGKKTKGIGMGKATIWHVIGGLVATLFCFFFIIAG